MCDWHPPAPKPVVMYNHPPTMPQPSLCSSVHFFLRNYWQKIFYRWPSETSSLPSRALRSLVSVLLVQMELLHTQKPDFVTLFCASFGPLNTTLDISTTILVNHPRLSGFFVIVRCMEFVLPKSLTLSQLWTAPNAHHCARIRRSKQAVKQSSWMGHVRVYTFHSYL